MVYFIKYIILTKNVAHPAQDIGYTNNLGGSKRKSSVFPNNTQKNPHWLEIRVAIIYMYNHITKTTLTI